MSLHFCYDIQMAGSQFDLNSMKGRIHPAPDQSFSGLGENSTARLSIVADHVHTFMTTV